MEAEGVPSNPEEIPPPPRRKCPPSQKTFFALWGAAMLFFTLLETEFKNCNFTDFSQKDICPLHIPDVGNVAKKEKMSHSVPNKSKKNPNTNCLSGMACPKCGNFESLEIETLGVIDGTKRVSRFWTLVTDEGTENPVTVGETECPEDGKIACPACDFEGTDKDFFDSTSNL